MSSKNQRMEEQRVQLWWRQWSATLRDAQVPSSHIFIIFILTNWRHLVDCKVGDWKPWGDCSVTCDGGTKTRARDVIEQPENGGATCPALEETKVCNTEGCPGYFLILLFDFHHIFSKCGSSVDCKVGDWKPWGECSVTCDNGTKTRKREVVKEPENGGASCPDLEETEVCNTDQCKGALFILSRLVVFHLPTSYK